MFDGVEINERVVTVIHISHGSVRGMDDMGYGLQSCVGWEDTDYELCQ